MTSQGNGPPRLHGCGRRFDCSLVDHECTIDRELFLQVGFASIIRVIAFFLKEHAAKFFPLLLWRNTICTPLENLTLQRVSLATEFSCFFRNALSKKMPLKRCFRSSKRSTKRQTRCGSTTSLTHALYVLSQERESSVNLANSACAAAAQKLLSERAEEEKNLDIQGLLIPACAHTLIQRRFAVFACAEINLLKLRADLSNLLDSTRAKREELFETRNTDIIGKELDIADAVVVCAKRAEDDPTFPV